MRQIDDATLAALNGSRTGDSVVVYVWYNGSLAYPDPLPLSRWSFNWDTSRQVQSFDIEVADPDGVLAPWLLSDPLGVGGSELQVRYDVGNAGSVNMGWYRIARNTPDERWRTYTINDSGVVRPADSPLPPGKRTVYVSGGATISVSSYDRAFNIKKDRLLAPESPPSTSLTIMSEIARLNAHIVPVVATAGVVDRNVSRNLVYERDRLDATQDLCKRILCDYRMNGDGQLEVYPIAEATPVATLQGGPEGLLIRVDRSQDVEGLANTFIVDGNSENTDGTPGAPIRAIEQILDGDLSATGPFGRVPEFYSSTMITSQDDADAYAFQMKVTQLTGLTVDLEVTCLPLPHIQQGDWVTVANPVWDGQTIPLTGKVKAMSLTGTSVPDAMKLIVQCSYWDVQTAITGVKRGTF